MDMALETTALLVKHYGLVDVLGHEDISPIRKSDPGPAFPMSSFRSRAMGRANESQDEYETGTVLNIRSGPGTNYGPLTDPLPKGTKVVVLKTEGTWSFVEVNAVVHGVMDLEGWVSTKYLIKDNGL
jgi:N-acetylmuramoyl-L-alanine amidase